MDETTLLLVRHGATEWNLRRPYVLQGRTIDASLAEIGRRQAEAVARALHSWPLAAVYASPFLRARETAECIAGPNRLPVVHLPEVGEIDIGAWEGLGWVEARTRWPAEVAAFESDAAVHGYLHGENFTQLRDRVAPALESLRAAHPGETIAVVAHNVVNRVALAHWMGLPLGLSRRLPQANGAYNVVELRSGRTTVRTINAAEHLSGLLPAD